MFSFLLSAGGQGASSPGGASGSMSGTTAAQTMLMQQMQKAQIGKTIAETDFIRNKIGITDPIWATVFMASASCTGVASPYVGACLA